jgi:hypothetical protein
MHQIIIKLTRVVVQNAKYIVVSCDEVTTIDNQSWCNVHAYAIGGFKRRLLLLNLEKVFGGISFVNNLSRFILKPLVEYGGVTVEQITNKLVCFGSNGVVMFTSVHTSVTMRKSCLLQLVFQVVI